MKFEGDGSALFFRSGVKGLSFGIGGCPVIGSLLLDCGRGLDALSIEVILNAKKLNNPLVRCRLFTVVKLCL